MVSMAVADFLAGSERIGGKAVSGGVALRDAVFGRGELTGCGTRSDGSGQFWSADGLEDGAIGW
jgi:hypothetical protein